MTGLLIRYHRERDRQFWLTLCRELETESDSPLRTNQTDDRIPSLSTGAADLSARSDLHWSVVWGVGWPQVSPPSSPPLITSGGSLHPALASPLCPRGEPGKHIPDFWTVCPGPSGLQLSQTGEIDNLLELWPLCLNFVFPKLGLPPSHSHPTFVFWLFLFHNKSYLASPGERSATLQHSFSYLLEKV